MDSCRSGARHGLFGLPGKGARVHSVVSRPSVASTSVRPTLWGRSTFPLPRPLLWACGVVVVGGIVMGVLGALRTGISWDEPYHVMRLRNFIGHGAFALDWAFEGEGPTSSASNTAVYGPVAMLLLHALGALLGVEGWGEVSTSPAAYDVRHVGVALIGFAGTAAAAGITRVLTGSWRWALFTAATLFALPMWTGHLMFNVKDVPVATGYTLMTLALVTMTSPTRRHRSIRVLALVAGIVLMVGTRPAMVSAVVAGLVVILAGHVVAGSLDGPRPALEEALAGSALAAVALLLIYPNLFAHPTLLVQSAEQSASFRDGRDAAYGYVPFHVVAQVPLLLQACCAIGLVTALGLVLRRWRSDPVQATRLALVAAQLAALPVLAIALHSDLYNGLRQLLFASPAWAVFVTLGAAKVLDWGQVRGRSRAVGGLAVVALALPALDQVLLFPYQYTYFNPAVDASGLPVPSDYWRTSVPELMPRIPTDGQIICGPTRSGDPTRPGVMVAGRYSSDSSADCRLDPLGPLAPAWAARGLPLGETLPDDEFYALIDRDHPVPENCTRLAAVTRERHFREIAMTYVARCRLEPSELGATPVVFTRSADEPTMASEAWAYAPRGWAMRGSLTSIAAQGNSASLTFAVPESCARRDCMLILDADAPSDLTVAVNDVATRAAETAGSVAVRLPRGAAHAWVTFRRDSGGPLELRLRSIRVIPVETT